MLLATLVEVSTAVAATRSRLDQARPDRRAAARDRVGGRADEIDIAASYLSGTLRQRRTGVGWRGLSDAARPGRRPRRVTLTEVDATLEEISVLSGSGSAGARRDGRGRRCSAALTAPSRTTCAA